MQIQLSNAGKKFNRDWIFRNLEYQLTSGQAYAITGPNGSGKSTLLQCIAGSMTLSTGACHWQYQQEPIEADHVYRHIALAAPYLEIIEEMTAAEFLQFHQSFKPLLPGLSIPEILRIVDMEHAAQKQIRYYSSGMKQRIKLAQAVFSDTAMLLLDEPCTNLDKKGYQLYQELISRYAGDRLVIVSSNDPEEYLFCSERIDILDYK
ncbi:MAG: ATP-binding cassette domain-containing protein [Chitinophagaceae bacterium]|jgi:ABC-type multidrug transport system ATPase subunit|nr:ATP-binding cassette domain-containing protein [Chitinophagaceae bacterium]